MITTKQDNVFSGNEFRTKLMSGINKVADAVKITYGAAGTNVILEVQEYPYTIVTNDGVTVAEKIFLSDPIENMGRNILLETISRANKQSGDGSTGTTILTQKILEEGNKIRDQISPLELKKSLEECLPIIEESIDGQTKEITVDDVGTVAAISAEDESIGALIQEIYQKIGKDGILYPDVSKTFEDYYTLGQGVKIEGAGFVSPYMADMDDKGNFLNVAQYKNPKILIVKQKITNAKGDLLQIFSQLASSNIKELIIFADDFEPTLIPDLVTERARSGFKSTLVKMPVLWKDWWFEDLAKLTGATIIDGIGITFKSAKLVHLGTCSNVTVDKSDTFLDGTQDISGHIRELEENGDDGDDGKIRAARLNTKTARFFVGAQSDAALGYKRLKVEDARNAAWQALHGGIVAGGGIALMDICGEMPDTPGGRIMRNVLAAPTQQIMLNAGSKLELPDLPNMGFDAKTGKIVNMWEANIIDPAMVIKNSVRNAISVASMILTAPVGVLLPEFPQQPTI